MIFILKEKNGVSSCNETILVTSTRVGIIVLGKANIAYFNFPFGKMFTCYNHLLHLFLFQDIQFHQINTILFPLVSNNCLKVCQEFWQMIKICHMYNTCT